MAASQASIVYTNKARCRDCYRCVRVCPVKAIRMTHGQASVVPERCILCGACIRECPQGAKAYRSDIERAAALIAAGERVAVSLAPSFAAAFRPWEWRRVPSALRRLGFAHVAETSVGAWPVAQATAAHARAASGGVHFASSCPAFVRCTERHHPERTGDLVPVVSPMIAHAKMIRQRGLAQRIVFIGPCAAKKAEAERPEHAGLVDCVLTFEELAAWLHREGIELAQLEESGFDERPAGQARLFPIAGGALRTAEITPDPTAPGALAVHGFDQVEQTLAMDCGEAPQLIEPLMCPQGCIGGPGMIGPDNLLDRRRRVLDYARSQPGRDPFEPETPNVSLAASFAPAPLAPECAITEPSIRRVLERMGKVHPEDQLNCAACGYATCRDKAIAVLRGMAEAEMCIPHMRKRAEQRTDRIIETSPNGIVILDAQLRILSMNPAFRQMFLCGEALVGKPISHLMDPDPFERLASGEAPRIDFVAEHHSYGCVCHEILYRLPEDDQFAGIFVNITETRADRERLDHLRAETVTQARELIAHQIQMAQRIASFLGESTAQGEQLVDRLVALAGAQEGAPRGGTPQPWTISTST